MLVWFDVPTLLTGCHVREIGNELARADDRGRCRRAGLVTFLCRLPTMVLAVGRGTLQFEIRDLAYRRVGKVDASLLPKPLCRVQSSGFQ